MLFSLLLISGCYPAAQVEANYCGQRVVFDIVVYDAFGRPRLIVELKRDSKEAKAWVRTRQCRRYRRFGLTVALVWSMKQAEPLVKLAKSLTSGLVGES